MADRGDTHYRGGTLHRWFALSSVLLLISVFWMVVDDFYAPWKVYQREFYALDEVKTVAQIEGETMRAEAQAEAAFLAEFESLQEALDEHGEQLDEAEAVVFERKGEFDAAVFAEKKQKEDINWAVFHFEEHLEEARQEGIDVERDEAVAQERADVDAMYTELNRLTEVREARGAELDGAVQVRDAITAARDDKASQAKDAAKGLDLLRVKRDKLDPEDPLKRLAKIVRDDIPGLDFIGPNLKIDKVVLPNLSFELNFTKGLRIDMCRTCHMGIDDAGWDEDEQPYRSHPRLDLYLSSSSPHPYKEVGCTICHRGSGQALDFQRADHRPSDEAEGLAWEDDLHWHKQHHWDYPMLSSGYVEAGCVQCHTDSMELIAPEAPRVTEGYRSFERYGCYACHKVEWFPTKRRPGPSLKGLWQKFSPEWAAAWIADPKAFRPTTWMPQFFHLENFAPEAVIATSEWGLGRDILGQEWNDSAVSAITSYLFQNHSDQALPPLPVQGDVARGREEFRLVGCLACHNVAPWEEEDIDLSGFPDPAQRRSGTNEHGPSLRGIATKVNAEWLYWWLKDPHAYWSQTRMPDLRLSDQQAADITAYIMDPADVEGFFSDTPAGWQPGFPTFPEDGQLRQVLQEQARWFFMREGREDVEGRFEPGGVWANTDEGNRQLEFDVGHRFVLFQGCFSCHEIRGLEDTMPIGAELTNWGSKTVDKLDWGFIADHMAAEELKEVHGEDATAHGNYEEWFTARKHLKQYREPWIEQKLAAPRSFDRDKVKSPLDRLRMPFFGFGEERAQEIATFVVGLVDDEVQRASMVPDAAQLSMDVGLRAIRQKNCAACHVIEPGEVDFLDADGAAHTVRGAITYFDEDPYLPPPMADWDEYRADYEAYMRDPKGGADPEFELEEVIVRLLRTEPDQATGPDTGDVGNSVILDPDQITAVRPAWGGDFVDVVTHYYRKGLLDPRDADGYAFLMPDPEGNVFDVDGEARPYYEQDYDKLRWTFAPPVLIEEGRKVQADWFFGFLEDPGVIRPQIRVRMPSFNWEGSEAEAVADYFALAAEDGHPARFARKLRQNMAAERGASTSPADVVEAAVAFDPGSALTPQVVRGIEDGDPSAITAGWADLEAFGKARLGFSQAGWDAVDPDYEAISRRAPTHLAEVEQKLGGDYFAAATILAVDERDEQNRPVGKGVNCLTCHFLHGQAPPDNPIAWAPDLYLTHERLREDWVDEWLHNPALIYPGTAMPTNFPENQVQWQQAYPGTSEEQIQAILDWLYNLDRVYPPPSVQ